MIIQIDDENFFGVLIVINRDFPCISYPSYQTIIKNNWKGYTDSIHHLPSGDPQHPQVLLP